MPKQGEFVWHDLATPDVAAAKDFYKEIAGWQTVPLDPDMGYDGFMAGEDGVGGVMALTDEMKAMGAPPSWTPCIFTEDLDATCAKVKELGGQILKEPHDTPDGARFAVLQDPQGAVFECYDNDEGKGEASQRDPAPVGHFCWYDLNTTDWEGAREFYSKVFGWSESGSMDSPMGMYWMFKSQSGDRTVGGMSNGATQMKTPAHWLCYFTVEDLDAAVERFKALGGKVMNGPMEVPGGDRIAHCMDPQGAAIALHARPKG